MKLHLFFMTQYLRPYKFGKAWTASSKEYEVVVRQVHEIYNREKLRVTGQFKDESVAKELKVLSVEKKSASMAKARVVATRKLAEKRTRQVINLKAKV